MDNRYEIWSRIDLIEHRISKGCDMNKALDSWNKNSKGFNFVVAMYIEGINDYMVYSVPYFNERILGGQQIRKNVDSEEVSVEDLHTNSVSFNADKTVCPNVNINELINDINKKINKKNIYMKC